MIEERKAVAMTTAASVILSQAANQVGQNPCTSVGTIPCDARFQYLTGGAASRLRRRAAGNLLRPPFFADFLQHDHVKILPSPQPRARFDADHNVQRDEKDKIRYSAPFRFLTHALSARFSERVIQLLLQHHPDALDADGDAP
jgi:hypothetical protein